MSKLNLIAAITCFLFIGQSSFARDVEVFHAGKSLYIIDSFENNPRYFEPTNLSITDVNGVIRVRGYANTRVNGQISVDVAYPNGGDIVVEIMEVGGSLVSLQSLNLWGTGDDIIVNVSGSAFLHTCSAFNRWHSDIIVKANFIEVDACGCERDMKLSAPGISGQAVINVLHSTAHEDLLITGNNSRNTVTVYDCHVVKLTEVKMKGGNDELEIDDLSTGSLVADMGSGQDALFINATHPADEWYVGGSGSDVVYQDQTIVHGGNSIGFETIGK